MGFLNNEGVARLWEKVKAYVDSNKYELTKGKVITALGYSPIRKITPSSTEGCISVAYADGTGVEVKVGGLRSAAYTDSTDYAEANHSHKTASTSSSGFMTPAMVTKLNSITSTTYSAGTGISLSGTTFSNSGVRSIATGSSNGTISVNTNGTTANVAVKGLGSAAYTASTAYATSGHNHDGRYLRQYGLNEININSTGGTWTVDISDTSHGSVPTPWVNVTQFSSGHFLVQMAIKCDNDGNANRAQGAVWFRNKYVSGAWSQWRQV